MRFYLSLIVFLTTFCVEAQQETVKPQVVDSLYREDQFYLNLSFSNLQKSPAGLKQNKISPMVAFGFLRDMPINKMRTWAFAAGVGYTLNVINDNLFLDNTSGATTYQVNTQISYDKNKMTLQYLDLPIEIRWRTSTFDSHEFWRIYTGFKMSYLVNSKYTFVSNTESFSITKNSDLNRFQYGLYVAMGRNTWNFYAYYGLNPLFKSAAIDGVPIKMNSFNMGLQFYIL